MFNTPQSHSSGGEVGRGRGVESFAGVSRFDSWSDYDLFSCGKFQNCLHLTPESVLKIRKLSSINTCKAESKPKYQNCPQLTPERVLEITKLYMLITGRMQNHKSVCD